MTPPPLLRLVLAATALASLLAAVAAGLLRLSPVAGMDLLGGVAGARLLGASALHGPLFLSAFFGTLVSLERAVAVGASLRSASARRAAYAVPAIAALGAVLLLAGAPAPAAWVFVAAGAGLVALHAPGWRRAPGAPVALLALGALLWTFGSAAWATGATVAEAVPWWAAFLVATIAAERLDLSRLVVRGAGAPGLLIGLVLLLAAGAALDARLVGASFLGLAAWLLRYDIARRTLRTASGLPRFVAATLLGGHAWLAAAGALWIAAARGGRLAPGLLYDAALHALFVGFVVSMVFAHAPIVAEAVLGLRVPFSPALYAAPLLLHASLAARVAGDLLGEAAWRVAGGWGNAAAIAAYPLLAAARRRAVP